MKCGLERFSKRRYHFLDSVGFIGPEDAIVFASATAHEARTGVILDGVDARMVSSAFIMLLEKPIRSESFQASLPALLSV